MNPSVRVFDVGSADGGNVTHPTPVTFPTHVENVPGVAIAITQRNTYFITRGDQRCPDRRVFIPRTARICAYSARPVLDYQRWNRYVRH